MLEKDFKGVLSLFLGIKISMTNFSTFKHNMYGTYFYVKRPDSVLDTSTDSTKNQKVQEVEDSGNPN